MESKISGGTVTLNPGTYVLNGGGLTIQGANTTVNGTGGVFFYNTVTAGYTAGSLLVSGQPTVSMKSPSSGPYQGIMFMQDHSVCPSTSHAINGNTNIKLNGTIYAHCTQPGAGYVAQNLLYTGESSTGYYGALVVDTLQINGMSNLVLDPTGGQNTGIDWARRQQAFSDSVSARTTALSPAPTSWRPEAPGPRDARRCRLTFAPG